MLPSASIKAGLPRLPTVSGKKWFRPAPRLRVAQITNSSAHPLYSPRQSSVMASAGGLGLDHKLAGGHTSAHSMPGCRLPAAGSSGGESARAELACASQKAVGPAEPEAAKQQGGCPVPHCHSF